MATSVSRDISCGEGNMMLNPGTGIAFEIEVSECVISNSPVPKWLRLRLEENLESKAKSLEDIETRLKEADLRRQQFHEWLANKARPRPRVSPPYSPQSEDLAQRLEAKLSAAEHKRGELLAQEQMRLARIHELRLAAKTETQLRMEREREELGCKVELRVHQAEANRLAILEIEKQRRAAAHERMAQSVMTRTNQEGKERERIEALRVAIGQKIAAAEEKRAVLLEAEKSRAQATVLQARRVAQEVVRERELELLRKKEKLEARLQRARRQRAEFLRQRGGCRGACHNHGQKLKQGDRLCRKLTRCWRQFRQSRCTTYALAQDYSSCGLSGKSVISIAFEQLASRITSPITLRSVKALLARIESRLKLSLGGQASSTTRIDHLLKRLSPPGRKPRSSTANVGIRKHSSQSGSKGVTKEGIRTPTMASSKAKDGQKVEEKELDRYPARVFLCAYMILGQPEAVFSGQGQREMALAEAAARLLPEFETLMGIILDGPSSTSPPGPSSPNGSPQKRAKSEWPTEVSTPTVLPSPRPFAAQLSAFDASWCAYLYQFVAWKVKDARDLEEDMTRMACQLEISMLQKCKVPLGGDLSELSHDAKAIQTQVLEDQKLLRDRVLHLTGTAGLARMEEALIDARTKHAENSSPLTSPFSSPNGSGSLSMSSASDTSPDDSPISPPKGHETNNISRPKVARSLFKFPNPDSSSSDSLTGQDEHEAGIPVSDSDGTVLTNEHIVNEMLHDSKWQLPNMEKPTNAADFTSLLNPSARQVSEMQAQVRSAMEIAFWDSIAEGLAHTPTDYKRVVSLVGEVREELEALVPEEWKVGLRESMDLELIAQILESGTNDVEYLRRLLDYASGLILKLGSPARDSKAKAAHQSLVEELSATVSSDNKDTQSAFFITLVKGLRFIFEQLQVLKEDISTTRLRALAPLISGTAGVEYMRKAFTSRYQLATVTSSAEVIKRLPCTSNWFSEGLRTFEQEKMEVEVALASVQGAVHASPLCSSATGLPPVSTMRTGGRISITTGLAAVVPTAGSSPYPPGGKRLQDVQWDSNITIVRLGLLRILSSNVAVTEESVPETLSLNIVRLHNCQNAFQRILVIATGLLVARQGLVGQGIVGGQLENIMENGKQKLETLLNKPTATLSQIGAVLAQIASRKDGTEISEISETPAATTELMTRVLGKSLSPEDPVFSRVSNAVVASLRALLVLGKNSESMAMAESALKRIGGSYFMDKVVATADALEVIAGVTCRIHEPWYSCLAETSTTQQSNCVV